MKREAIVLLLLCCATLGAAPVDVQAVTADSLEKWASDSGLTKDKAGKFVDAIRDHGKADAAACQARAAALIRFFSRNPEDFLRQPGPYLDKALLLSAKGFEDDPSIPDPAPLARAAQASSCPDPFKLKSSGEAFTAMAQVYPEFLVPTMAKRELFRLGLPMWAMELEAAIHPPCPPASKPGLFEDFEHGDVFGAVPYSEKGVAQAMQVPDLLDPNNHCLKLSGSLQGWGYGAYFESHYATRPLGHRTKIAFRALSDQALDIYLKLGENSAAPSGPEKWSIEKAVKVAASPRWQAIEVPIGNLKKEANYQGDKGWEKLGNGKLDMDALQRVEIFVNKGEKGSANLYIDDIEFK